MTFDFIVVANSLLLLVLCRASLVQMWIQHLMSDETLLGLTKVVHVSYILWERWIFRWFDILHRNKFTHLHDWIIFTLFFLSHWIFLEFIFLSELEVTLVNFDLQNLAEHVLLIYPLRFFKWLHNFILLFLVLSLSFGWSFAPLILRIELSSSRRFSGLIDLSYLVLIPAIVNEEVIAIFTVFHYLCSSLQVLSFAAYTWTYLFSEILVDCFLVFLFFMIVEIRNYFWLILWTRTAVLWIVYTRAWSQNGVLLINSHEFLNPPDTIVILLLLIVVYFHVWCL